MYNLYETTLVEPEPVISVCLQIMGAEVVLTKIIVKAYIL